MTTEQLAKQLKDYQRQIEIRAIAHAQLNRNKKKNK